MKTFPVYTILWVVSFLVKHGQPASFPSSPNHYSSKNNDFMTESKAGQIEAMPDIKEIRVKRNIAEVSRATDIPANAQPFNAQGNLISSTVSYASALLAALENGTKLNDSELTTPFSASRNTMLINTTGEDASYVTASTNDTENVTQFDTQTRSVNTSEETSTPYVTTTPLITTTTKSALNEKCERDTSCINEFAICRNQKCVCEDKYFRLRTKCEKKLAYGKNCSVEECLDKRAHCNEQHRCDCFEVYFWKHGKCVDKKGFDEKCEEGDQCKARNAYCSTETKRCTCSDNYKQSETICVKIVFPYWWLGIIIAILILVILVFIYLFLRQLKQTTGNVNFLKLRPFKTLSHKRPYKIKNFLHMDSKTFIQDYKIIGKVNPFILTEESDQTSNDTFLPCTEAQKLQNKKKNRFLNVLPFDHSRVQLDVIDDDPFTDYINANYITGYNQEKEYIACQGPLIHTVDDFWRMVWQENINLIVMLTLCEENGKHKCYPYWPKKEKLKVISRDLLLETDVVINHEYYNESSILVNMDEESRIVKHLHFQKWPDFSATVDPTVLINFIKIIRSHFTQSPILVHCSAGVGRTGTLIAVDYMMQYVRDHTLDDSVDLFSFVYKMRENRPQMVQNQDQYLLINTCIRKAIMDKFNLKDTQINKEEENKKNEVRVDVEEGGDTENCTETDEDDADDVEDSAKILTNKVEEKEDDTKEPIVKVEANVAAENTNKVENAKTDVTQDAKDDGENVDEATGDTGEDKDANSNMYTNDYQEDADETVPLTQVTSEL
ncbi:receptor-type tyrosine-protein phosphatase C isoform X1 [Octopus vulgaris]|uniref:Receptor-type tyrosine-protein phosphatase C isoform X1 n=1 Tax=Octopus vulgaris TaxID=6645 RepID=A0AA36AKC4_OCTVU|nr:receptor-type tyrosine-protein phosphatase C isoform X1 [Octopus vulgaris]